MGGLTIPYSAVEDALILDSVKDSETVNDDVLIELQKALPYRTREGLRNRAIKLRRKAGLYVRPKPAPFTHEQDQEILAASSLERQKELAFLMDRRPHSIGARRRYLLDRVQVEKTKVAFTGPRIAESSFIKPLTKERLMRGR